MPRSERRRPPLSVAVDLQRLFVQLDLLQAIEEALDTKQINLIVLQDVPLLLQHNVVRIGEPIFARNTDVRRAFVIGVEQAYEDEEPYLERETAIMLKRILATTA